MGPNHRGEAQRATVGAEGRTPSTELCTEDVLKPKVEKRKKHRFFFFFNLLTYYISPNILRVESLLYEASFNITHSLENVQIDHYVEKNQ